MEKLAAIPFEIAELSFDPVRVLEWMQNETASRVLKVDASSNETQLACRTCDLGNNASSETAACLCTRASAQDGTSSAAPARGSCAVSAFWHTVGTWTSVESWNRQLWKLDVEHRSVWRISYEAGHAKNRLERMPDSQCDVRACSSSEIDYGRPELGTARLYLRRLYRKNPSPSGGGPQGNDRSYDVLEWAVHRHYLCELTPADGDSKVPCRYDVDEAIFGLLVPQGATQPPHNPRALTFWPFGHPKARFYAVRRIECAVSGIVRLTHSTSMFQDTDSIANDNELLDDTHSHDAGRSFEASRPYAEISAANFLHTVHKWTTAFDSVTSESTYVKRVHHDVLLSQNNFRDVYSRLKDKYGFWANEWPERTDPVKYVFEEMAIAAYLIALWESLDSSHSRAKPSFCDLGCGNGFLTYLLLSEGYAGVGIDLQKRGIWDIYPPSVGNALLCEELRLDFSNMDHLENKLCEYEWILGNHSDELTPWIPYIASRTRAKVFLLPCCFWDFANKMVFSRLPDHGEGRYRRYLWYIHSIMQACGWKAEQIQIENLRIPSSKYIAFIVLEPSCRPGGEETRHFDLEVQELLQSFIGGQLARVPVRESFLKTLAPDLVVKKSLKTLIRDAGPLVSKE
ncbi:putative tRNA (uracil-O(2)-)-methyltransferase [Porphyridium purpureum]|uniref:tRNA (uracil-O(2)-)-methyltransferase n=1 Tax=Porphyridium purpureum TaxID=35688 RepID=A0A5J4YL95_PORPP|nr:putative tRNA (uracil-O(2)-)-methyltransferase [Porphyridium purpureum]|eukprot:POR2483..scf291_13